MFPRQPLGVRGWRAGVLASAWILLTGASLRGEEGGTGHYLPGSMASFVDGIPLEPAFIARLNSAYWEGSIDSVLPIAGQETLGVDASLWANGLTLLWRPPFEIGEPFSFALSATVPYVSAEVTGGVVARLPGGRTATVARTDTADGLGDIVLMPLMLNANVHPDFNINFRLGIYAPTGDYETGRLANTGKNFWTVEPVLGLMYFGKQNGFEASVFAGADFNEENPDTHYKSGTQVHIDATFAQHFPLWGGLAGAGLTGHYYRQVTGDSGSGARFGSFKANSNGVGPVVSYSRQVGGVDLTGELKWVHEFENKRRPQGDFIWFKLVCHF